MNVELNALVEQVSIVNGEWERAPHNQIAAHPAPRNLNHKGALFVMAQVQGQFANLDVVEKRLVTLVKDTYYATGGGITASLRRATQTANQWLFQYNSTTKSGKTVVAGVVAAVMHGEDLFVAQVGPTALFANLNGFVLRIPEASTWLDPIKNPTADYSPALGLHHFVEANISHLQMQPNDIVVLADARLARQLPPQMASKLITGKNLSAICQTLINATHTQNGSVMAIQIAGNQHRQPAAAQAERVPVPSRPSTPASKNAKNGFDFAMTMPTQKTRRNTSPDNRSTPTPQPRLPLPAIPVPNVSLAQMWRKLVAITLGTVAFLGNGLHTIFRLVLPGTQVGSVSARQAGMQARPLAEKQPTYQALTVVAVTLPLLAVALGIITYLYLGHNSDSNYLAALNQATQAYEQALTAPQNSVGTLLATSAQYLNQAENIKAGQPEVQELRNKIQAKQDELDKVQYLFYVPLLKVFNTPGTQLKKVVKQGNHLYVFDAGLNRVSVHTVSDIGDNLLDESELNVIAQAGQQIENVAMGPLMDIVWMPAGGNRQVKDLLLVATNGLFEYDPVWETTVSSINGMDKWQTPVATGSYYGNFYVLDAQANQIYRYLPTDNGYDAPPDNYFASDANVNLNGAIDMAIDGAIYVLYQDGRIAKFLQGEPAPFQIAGLNVPLNNPVTIFTAPDELVQYLYVVDRGNQRIVQLSKEGQFIAQFKPKTNDGLRFDNLQSVYVDEIAQKMFVLNNNALYAPNIPTMSNQQQPAVSNEQGN